MHQRAVEKDISKGDEANHVVDVELVRIRHKSAGLDGQEKVAVEETTFNGDSRERGQRKCVCRCWWAAALLLDETIAAKEGHRVRNLHARKIVQSVSMLYLQSISFLKILD